MLKEKSKREDLDKYTIEYSINISVLYVLYKCCTCCTSVIQMLYNIYCNIL